MTRRLVAGALALAALAAPAAARAAVVPLSADRSPADVDSRFGSGAFGRWTIDTLGLPAFRYTIDQQVFPPARQPELKGATEAQHQLGNDHIVAAAFNHGYTQLWSQDRLPQWANRYDPENGHYGGGLRVPQRRRPGAEHALPRPPARRADASGCFGTGYYERRLRGGRPRGARARLRAVRRRPAPAARRDDPQPHAEPRAGVLVRVLGREPVHRGGRTAAVRSGHPSVDAEPQDAVGAAGVRRPRRRAAAEHLRRGAEGPRRRLRDVRRAVLRRPARARRRPPWPRTV